MASGEVESDILSVLFQAKTLYFVFNLFILKSHPSADGDGVSDNHETPYLLCTVLASFFISNSR